MKCIRKFTPVSPYDIQGLESWLQDLALQGLYLAWFRPLFSTFVQNTPRQVRYRVEFCKEADRDGPPQDLKDLYRDFSWDYVGRAWDSTLLIFRTRDSRAEELHTDPPLQGELLEKLARRLGRRFFGQLALTLVLALLCAVLMGPAPVAQLVTHPQLPVFLLCLILSLLGLPSPFRSWRRTIRLARQLREGAPLAHQVPYPRRNRKSLAEFSAAVVLLSLLAVTWFWDVSGEYLRSTQEIEDFTPLPWARWSGEHTPTSATPTTPCCAGTSGRFARSETRAVWGTGSSGNEWISIGTVRYSPPWRSRWPGAFWNGPNGRETASGGPFPGAPGTTGRSPSTPWTAWTGAPWRSTRAAISTWRPSPAAAGRRWSSTPAPATWRTT